MTRRSLLAAVSAPLWARSALPEAMKGVSPVSGREFELEVGAATAVVDGRRGKAVTVNGRFPGPLLRWREGDEVVLRVTNRLHEDTSIHWHGILLPFQMDGVPGVTFPGIRPGETFEYRFPVRQSGTYWYHSHSGLQEQVGHYGPLVIDPAGEDPVEADREYVVVLSDWSFTNPHRIFAKLKKMSDNFNFQKRTVGDFFRDASDGDFKERGMWGRMRMSPTDIADVTGAEYTYLVNGHSPKENWSALFEPGERVRLRIINASAMTIFDVRIPGLPMTVVQSDGLNVRPIETDEFQMGVAETYDVVVRPEDDQAFTLMGESIDRSGYARATLCTRPGMEGAVPTRRRRPLLTMQDMGMAHHAHHGHSMESMGEAAAQEHPHAKGPGVMNTAAMPSERLGESGAGLNEQPHRTLSYMLLESLEENPDPRPPEREIELHLTSNMERYMWSFDGVKFSDVEGPIVFYEGERVRLTMINDTMMPHPIHLHGMFFDVVTVSENHKPRKHTIIVKPAEKVSVDVTADAVGDWAFHCHLLYHMHAGMMQVVSVRPRAT